MTFLEAAEEVLRRSGKALTARQITEKAMARGLIRSGGKTPEATMSSALYRAPTTGPIRREFEAGNERARRGSVRWKYVAKRR
jgi:HB1, ASXL, restriction endonuclease HTH domain